MRRDWIKLKWINKGLKDITLILPETSQSLVYFGHNNIILSVISCQYL